MKKIGTYLCDKYKAMIQNNQTIDLDEMATELEGLNLADLCPELYQYLESIKDTKIIK